MDCVVNQASFATFRFAISFPLHLSFARRVSWMDVANHELPDTPVIA